MLPRSLRRLPRVAALAAALCAAMLPGLVHAGPYGDLYDEYLRVRAQGRSTLSLGIDNDSLLLDKRDGFYTSGLRVDYSFRLADAQKSTAWGWRLGQELYTASDIKLLPSQLQPNDHPYAGWLYGGIYREEARADGTGFRAGLDVGCLGPCAGGEWTQSHLHRLIRQPQPEAWSTQLRNEWGAVLWGDYTPVRWNLSANADLAPNLHGRFGNIFTDAGIGLTLRAGQLNLLPGQDTLHGFLRVDAAAVGYNASLQGGYFSGASDNPRAVKPKRFVGEGEVGLQWTRGPWGLRASIVRRTNEVDGLPNGAGMQSYARLLFSWTPGEK